jgi:hypothetical protein
MRLDYGKKFTDQWGSLSPAEMKSHWVSEFFGYTPREIKRGLDAIDTKDWPPTLPEFKKMCRPPMDALKAYYEAVAGVQARAAGEYGKWSHPAVYWAATPLAFDLAALSFSQIKGRWESALDEQMAAGSWDEIPQPMLALAAPGKAELSKESAAKMMRELEAHGVTKKAGDRIDHKRWAKTIMQRIANGDKSVSMIQGQFAREALEISEEPA